MQAPESAADTALEVVKAEADDGSTVVTKEAPKGRKKGAVRRAVRAIATRVVEDTAKRVAKEAARAAAKGTVRFAAKQLTEKPVAGFFKTLLLHSWTWMAWVVALMAIVVGMWMTMKRKL